LPFVVHAFARELTSDRSETFVQSEFETFDFIVFGLEIITWSDWNVVERLA
jgi:hypothetical protein